MRFLTRVLASLTSRTVAEQARSRANGGEGEAPLRKDPDYADLEKAGRAASGFRVLSRSSGRSGILFECKEPTTVEELNRLLRVSGPAGHCMCMGDPLIEMFDGENTVLASVSLHHGISIRWDLWNQDAHLCDGRHLLEWLRDRGIAYPLAELEESIRRQKRWNEDWNRWSSAAPPLLRNSGTQLVNLHEVRTALEAKYADRVERSAALFRWLGNGAGLWNGYPAYESVPEKLLLDQKMPILLAAADIVLDEPAGIEGVARLFASWDFGRNRRKDLKKIPPRMRARLLEHAMTSDDTDKRSRATRAFG